MGINDKKKRERNWCYFEGTKLNKVEERVQGLGDCLAAWNPI